jgi:hypothetical protein
MSNGKSDGEIRLIFIALFAFGAAVPEKESCRPVIGGRKKNV